MDKPILFSVIIPTYNRADLIEKTIQSLLNQTYSNFEAIIVDDGSTDNTSTLISKIQDARVQYFYKENGERGAARNYGAKKASGHYAYFLDSDDLLYPHHLAEAAQFIHKHKHPQIFFLPYEIVDEKGKLIRSILPLKGSLNQILVTKGNVLSCHGVFIRKDVALENPFNEDRNLAGSEDYELWLRLASKFNIPYSDKVTSALVNHDQRSVLHFEKDKLISRKSLMLKYLFANESFMERFGKYKRKLKGNTYLYIALHLALSSKYKAESLGWLLKSLYVQPSSIFVRSFWGTLKHLFLLKRH